MVRAWIGFGRYVPVDERKRQAAQYAKERAKAGEKLEPVVIEGRKIAKSSWGVAWLDNLARYADFANRLPRGHTYARRGAVLDLSLERGRVRALVQGSSRYRVQIDIAPLSAAAWNRIKGDCAGSIDSVVELLAGKLAHSVMARMCEPSRGLFPEAREMKPSCSCPDAARLCKHVIAALCGIGNRLDSSPELLFRLRGVDERELVREAVRGVVKPASTGRTRRVIEDASLVEVFGLDVVEQTGADAGADLKPPRRARKATQPAAKAAATARNTTQARAPVPRKRATASAPSKSKNRRT